MSSPNAQLATTSPLPTPARATISLNSPSVGTGSTDPNWLGRLPDEVWTLVFVQLATSAGSSPLDSFLNLRLVCKLFDQLIRSEQVAFAAVVAINGNLLRDAQRVPMVKLTDVAESWWDVLMDQRRLDRVWLGGQVIGPDGERPAPTVRPGFEVLMLHVESSCSKSKLSHYDWPNADISYSPSNLRDEGVIGFLAYRRHVNDCGQAPLLLRSTPTNHRARTSGSRNSTTHNGAESEDASDDDDDDYKEFDYITVHILDFPSLHPITTHVLMDRGFGSFDKNSDLTRTAHYPANPATSSVPASMSLSLFRPLLVTMGHLDKENKSYSLICTDNWNNSIIHLRSYDTKGCSDRSSSAQSGRTVAAIYVPSSCYVTHLNLIPSQPAILRMFYIHKDTRLLHLVDLCRTTLTLVRETIVKHTQAYYFDYNPIHQPDVFILRPFASSALVCDVYTGAILHTIELPGRTSAVGQKVHGMVCRPLLRQLEQGTARMARKVTRAGAMGAGACDAATAPNLTRAQWIMEWVQGCEIGGDEDYLAKTSKCHARIVGVPAPPEGLPHVFNEFVEPPVQSGDLLGAHLCAMFSPNGNVYVADLRWDGCPESGMRHVWSVGRRFTSTVTADSQIRMYQSSVGGKSAEASGKGRGDNEDEDDGCEEEFAVVVKRVGPAAICRTLSAKTPTVVGCTRAGSLGAELSSADKSDDSKDEDYSASDDVLAASSGSSEDESESEEDEDDGDVESSWDETGELIALGGRGDALLVQRGPVLAILQRSTNSE